MPDEVRLVDCDCDDWAENVAKINEFIQFGYSHGMKYEGAFFKFCPWCGKKRDAQ